MNETAETWKLRVARRLLIAEQELLKETEAHSELVIELIGSAVADWTLAQCKLRNILTEEQEAPPTSAQLENLKNCDFIESNQFNVLSTAYRARNLAHHEQIGLEVEQCVQLLNAVNWAVQNSLSSDTNISNPDIPIHDDDLLHLMQEVRRLSKTKPKKKGGRQIVMAIYQDQPFDSEWGPSNFNLEERTQITQAAARRGMLSGIIRNLHWPLITCDVCGLVVSVDNAWTPQEECMNYGDARIEAFCAFGCAKGHQRAVKELMKKDYYMWLTYYFLQNTVQMIRLNAEWSSADDSDDDAT